MFVMISCCEGFINATKHESMEDAKAQMREDYLIMLQENGCDPEEDNTRFGITELSAWFDWYDGRCDWQIVTL